jgi:hypothetical protein
MLANRSVQLSQSESIVAAAKVRFSGRGAIDVF